MGVRIEKKMKTLEETLGLGIDISKNRADICLKNSTALESFSISNDEQGIALLLQRLDGYRRSGCTIKGGIEVYAPGVQSNSAHKLLFYYTNPEFLDLSVVGWIKYAFGEATAKWTTSTNEKCGNNWSLFSLVMTSYLTISSGSWTP